MADGMIGDRPLAGRFDGKRHLYPVRVYYEDTDAGGIVYHAAYLHFAERARTEMMRLTAVGHGALLAEHGVQLAVHRCSLEFRRPARLDDALVVATRVSAVSGATVTLAQDVLRATDPARDDPARDDFLNLVALSLRLVTLDRQLRPARLPDALRAAVSNYL
jgi:acyl-CoA thioester hydrolase